MWCAQSSLKQIESARDVADERARNAEKTMEKMRLEMRRKEQMMQMHMEKEFTAWQERAARTESTLRNLTQTVQQLQGTPTIDLGLASAPTTIAGLPPLQPLEQPDKRQPGKKKMDRSSAQRFMSPRSRKAMLEKHEARTTREGDEERIDV